MNTVVESPNRCLRRELGLDDISSPSLRVDDWFPFCSGNFVYRKANPDHTGRVKAVISCTVRVLWDNGWVEDCAASELEKQYGKTQT